MKNSEDEAWIKYRQQFSEVYDHSNYEGKLQSYAMNASHKLVEKGLDQKHFSRVLEIGAGTGEHLKYIKHSFDQYYLSDLDNQALDVARVKNSDQKDVTFCIENGAELSFQDNQFDRVIAVHVLEHIIEPHEVIKEWKRVLKPGGTLSILIPTDPGFAWRLGRRLGPRTNALSLGIDYDYVMAREHVNSCVNLIALLRHYFPKSKERWWPTPFPTVDLNLFFALHAKKL